MKGKIGLALVALAAGLVGCGGAEESDSFGEVGPPTKAAPARSPRSNPDRGCAEQGIDTTRLREGTCTEDTTQFVVVNRGTPLRLESLVASVDRIAIEQEIGGVRPDQGAFLRFTLTVRNRREYAQRFDVGQTIVSVGESTFREAAEAEQAHARALATQGEGRIEPGGTLRGDVLFDVPLATAEQLASSGRFFVANFGEVPGQRNELTPRERQMQQLASAVGGTIAPDPIQLGQMRVYAGPEATSAVQ